MSQRILVVRNRCLGETVLVIPFLRNLRRRFPDAVVDVLVETRVGEVIADCPYVDELISWKRPPRRCGVVGKACGVLRAATWLRQRRYDRAYVLKRSFSTAVVVWLARIPHRVGFAADGRSPLLTRSVPRRRSRHEAELYLDHLRVDGIDVDDGRNENWVSAAAAEKVDRLVRAGAPHRPRVFLAPQSSSAYKQWPVDRMAAVIRWLVNERGCEVFMCGAPRDARTHAAIRGHLNAAEAAHMHDYSESLSLREALALVARMDLCIGVDSGLPHVAASFGVPVVTLFGPSDPVRWHPWKVTHAVVQPADGGKSMLGITVEQVIGAVSRLMHDAGIAAPAPRRPLRTIDLRSGSFRYEVIAVPAMAVDDVAEARA
jgi:heptosyltransferase-2